MRKLAATVGCMAIVAILCTASAAAAPVGLIEEFDVDGSAIVLAPGPDGNVWFTYDRDFNSPRGSAIGRISPRGKATLFRAGFRHGSELGGTLKARVTFTPEGGSAYSEYASIPVALRRR